MRNPMIRPARRLSMPITALCVLSLLIGPTLGLAAERTVPYRVQRGDNLYTLAARYLGGVADWPVLAKLNKVADPTRLPPDSIIQLPVSKLRGVAQTAKVVYVRGTVTVLDNKRQLRVLAVDGVVAEGDTLRVGPASFASLKLHDGSEVQVPANTEFRVQRMREVNEANLGQSVFKLNDGRLDFSVTPQRDGSRFEVQTPLAVTGVRGTHFGVAMSSQRRVALTDVVEGHVALASQGNHEAMLAAGEGAVVLRAGAAPSVHPLLPAPDLATIPNPVERLPLLLSISPVPGAVAYRVQIATDREFDQVLFNDDAAALPPTITQLQDGDYFLRVRALDENGLFGMESVQPLRVKTLPAPPLAQSPEQDQAVRLGRVRLLCTDLPDARGYQLQVARNGDFSSLLTSSTSHTATCEFGVDAAEEGEYFWRVATLMPNALGEMERGPFSDISRFRAVPAPSTPEPVFDSNNGLQAHWLAEPNTRFLVQVASEQTFADIKYTVEIAEPRVSLDLPATCGAYYLRLQSINSYGLRSAFSPARRIHGNAAVCTSDGPVRLGNGQSVTSSTR